MSRTKSCSRSGTFITVHVFLYLVLVGCQRVPQSVKEPPRPDRPRTVSDHLVHSTIGEVGAIWNWDLTTVDGLPALKAIHFATASNGWIGSSDGALYETNDSGTSWKKRQIVNLPNSYVSNIHFVDAFKGWVILAKNPPNAIDVDGYESEVMSTTDGGKTWRRQYWGTKLQLYRIVFLNEQEGWLAGRSFDTGAFVLHTTDQGAHWVDANGNLNKDLLGDYASDILPIAPNTAKVLTANGRVFKTYDAGTTWKVEDIQSEPLQVYVSRLGIASAGNLWVLGAADSKEGVWTTLSVRASTGAFNRYHIDGVNLVDVIFLSEKQVLACGSRVTDGQMALGRRESTILYSNDEGRSWTVAYKNAQIRSINSFAAGQQSHIWAVGDNGVVLRLESFPGKI